MILQEKTLRVTRPLLEAANIPPNFWKLQVGGVPCERTQEKMRGFLRTMPDWLQTNRGLMIFGNFCTGKTAFGCMLLREAISYSAECRFVYAAQAPVLWNKENERTGNLFCDDFMRADLLMIDDYGQEDSIFRYDSIKKIEFLVRARYDHQKPTIITTNLTIQNLVDHHGKMFSAVLQRAFPQSLSMIVQFGGAR